MKCPHCRSALRKQDRPPYLLWGCDHCDGCAATIAVLRRGIQHESLRRAWNRTIGDNHRVDLRCPGCSARMYRVPVAGPEIDLCRHCQLVWFDAGELEQMPAKTAAAAHADRWAAELAASRERSRDSAFYSRLWARHLWGMGWTPW